MYSCFHFFVRFATDTEAELELVRSLAMEAGAFGAVVANHWAKGGAGAAGKTALFYVWVF